MKQRFLYRLGLIVLIIGTSNSAVYAGAASYGAGTYGSCTYTQCSITVTSSGAVNVNVTPTSSGLCSVQSDTVSVLTDNSNGYTLTINTNSTTNALVNGTNSIAAINGTQASPVVLSNNSWGYRVDGVGSFGASPTTSPQTSSAMPSNSFAAVPTSAQTGDTLAYTNAAADPAVSSTVWFGVCVNTTLPSGTYTNQVVYTAVEN